MLPDGSIEAGPAGYRITVPCGAADLACALDLVAEAEAKHRRGDHAGALALIEDAARLWRGESGSDLDGASGLLIVWPRTVRRMPGWTVRPLAPHRGRRPSGQRKLLGDQTRNPVQLLHIRRCRNELHLVGADLGEAAEQLAQLLLRAGEPGGGCHRV